MNAVGIHRSSQWGISGGKDGSDSIVVNGGYPDDHDAGDEIIYTGQGGRAHNRHVADQELVLGNAGLKRAYEERQPIRVIRGSKGDKRFSPAAGYRYEGLFGITEMWPEVREQDGLRIWRFRLVKLGTEASAAPTSDPDEAEDDNVSWTGGHRTSLVKVRRGQRAFRTGLLEKYGLNCAVTGPAPKQVLQAAHLRAFADHGTHKRSEGLLLRSDIHSLFDAGLLAVDTADNTVVVAPSLRTHTTYGPLAGTALLVPAGLMPDRAALDDHHQAARARWALEE
ncbi:YDG/SRA domain-containing protein [Amycolatopsis rhabdoformis]|uniref:YDG/SRA domain-containing protein n=1 Tax=Amycolatopsis rhabdoformis TaxID=1448059 RepID=A0ABZ1I6B5_9PSEU|nr:YDG/SRA domain-containing protein [Amycolatopsis rhabdoformis]WSE29063.1 YDG/SRA domain-containing protein [Amycolatopsis rhabdoformis]